MLLRIVHRLMRVFGVVCLAVLSTAGVRAADGSAEQAILRAAEQNQPLFLMFYKDRSPAGDKMSEVLSSHPAVTSQEATWAAIRVTDPAERTVVEKYKVSRAPMPVVVTLYPNGAITGAFPTHVTREQLSSCLVSPKAAESLKLLQENRLVLICVQNSPDQALPTAVKEFSADPHFAARTSVIAVSAQDATEASFLTSMGLSSSQISSPVTVFLAPPGVHVGTFAASASKTELVTELASAGKCCNDKNCKHNQSTATQTR